MKIIKDPKIMLIISMIIFGTIGLFVKMIPLSSGEIALYRAILAAMLIGIYLLITKQKIDIKSIKKELILLLISGIAMGINWILLFESYNYTSVSVSTLSYYFAPSIVTLLSPILFKEKMNWKKWLCFAMSTIGLALITNPSGLDNGGKDIIGIAFGLGAAVFYATVIIMNKFIKNVGGIQRTFLQFLSAIVILIPYTLFTGGINLGNLVLNEWIFLLIVGLIHTGVTYCMYFTSLKELPGQRSAILSYIDPLVAVLVSVLILKEAMNGWQIVGGLMILGFTLWNEISSHKDDVTLKSKNKGVE